MSLQSGLYVGTSGLQTSQNALNTVAHNLSNVGTEGYVRQQVGLADRYYNRLSSSAAVSFMQTGLGVSYSQVRQVRDTFLDKTYREEAGRLSFYEASYNAIGEVETILGEMNGAAFNTSLQDLWDAVQEASKDPASTVVQGLIVQRASTFLQSAQGVYEALSSYQDNLNLQVKTDVDQINDYTQRIFDLNIAISKVEAGGTERANDLRDERNLYLDELAKLGNVSYTEDSFGSLSVKLEGVDLVNHDFVNKIGLYQDTKTGFYTPYWERNASYTINEFGEKEYDITGAEVFNFETPISADRDTDIGGLKAVLLARGDHRADYTDLLDGANYEKNISSSVIMNVMAEFDGLVHNIVTKINEIIAGSSDSATGYLCNEDGSPIQVFEKLTTPGYEMRTDASGNPVYDANGNVIWDYVKEQDGTDGLHVDSTSLYSLANIKINQELMQSPAKLGFVRADGKVDYDTLENMKKAFDSAEYNLNPSVVKYSNFKDLYSDMVAAIGNDGSVYKSLYENQNITVNSTEAARQQVIGVSSDEELSQMIRFQNAYNASSRYINVIDEMLEHILNTLGA